MEALPRPHWNIPVRSGHRSIAFRSAFRIPYVALPCILLLGLSVRLWVVSHSQVAARDSIGFIRYALNLESPPLAASRLEVLKQSLHPPGYPVAVLLMSWPVRALSDSTECDAMVRSAQLVSVFSGVLLALSMYFLGRRLFGPVVALLTTALFQVLPVSVQVTSDGLSDGLFLLLAATTLWLGVRALEQPSWLRFLACGMGAGLAYLVRPEGLMLVAAAGLALVFGRKLAAPSRWRQVLPNGLALVAGALLIAGPYMALIGGITNKPTGGGLLHGEDPDKIWKARPVEMGERPFYSLPLGAWWNDGINKGESRFLWATQSLFMEWLRSSHYLPGVLALFGLWLMRRRLREPAMLFLVVLAGMHAALLWLVAARAGYVSQRHTLLIVLVCCFFAAAAMLVVASWLAYGWRSHGARPTEQGLLARRTFWCVALSALLVALSLPAATKALHGNRLPHKNAGLWLAENASPHDQIIDPFKWAEFYAGRSLRVEPNWNVHAGNLYVVLEPNSPNPHSRLPWLPRAEYLARTACAVYHWPEQVPLDQAKVVVYRAPPLPFPPPEDFPKE
jgi:Dolichyl-phosphate-mannose-protein mannosyltransferase